ncbi:MAG: recombinase family protein [Clostridium sp.]|nr:recombinase family protein [Clostridium sp.]
MRKKGDCIAVYSRKSKFTGKGESIENQAELCREYVRIHYGETALEHLIVYEDEGFSGGDLNRPGFKKMMEAAGKRKFQALIVYRLDRISRNISDFAGLIEELSSLDIDFVSIKEQFDTRTPMGRAMMYIASVFSQLERETIAERIRDNMRELAKTGRWLGGTTPTGYASEAVETVSAAGKMKRSCRLKVIPEEADKVRLIYSLYLEFDSLSMTETRLMKLGIQTKNARFFTRFSIRGILQNPVYMIADQDAYEYFQKAGTEVFCGKEAFDGAYGMMVYNRTRQEKGRTAEFLPPEQWIVAVGRHPGLIPGRMWTAVQESLERNKTKAYRKPRVNEALATGLLFCSCGSRMYPKLGRKRKEGGRPYTYICRRRERSRGELCAAGNLRGEQLDRSLMEQIESIEEDRELFLSYLKEGRSFCLSSADGRQTQLLAVKKERDETEKKMMGLADSLPLFQDRETREKAVRHMEELDCKGRDLDREIQRLEMAVCQEKPSDAELQKKGRELSGFKSSMDAMTAEQKRAVLNALVRRIIWDGSTIHVVLAGISDEEMLHILKFKEYSLD